MINFLLNIKIYKFIIIIINSIIKKLNKKSEKLINKKLRNFFF